MARRLSRTRLLAVLTAASLALVSSVACSSRALAQTVSPSIAQGATLRVRLRHPDSLSVVGAEVSIRSGKAELTVRSDSNGVARVEGLPKGNVEIRVRRVGMKQVMLLARVEPGENEVTVNMTGNSAMLDEMRIIGNRTVSGRHEDFEMRLRQNDASAVITAAQIDKRNPVKLSTMLRGVAGLRLADSLGQTVAISNRGKKPSLGRPADCVMRIMIDGIVMSPQTSIDNVFPKDVYGVEVFNGPARMPLTMGGLRTDNWCGLIAIWTR